MAPKAIRVSFGKQVEHLKFPVDVNLSGRQVAIPLMLQGAHRGFVFYTQLILIQILLEPVTTVQLWQVSTF